MSLKEELEAQGFKAYESDEIRVFWNPNLCQHAAECTRGNRAVFDVMRKPWIDPNAASGAEIAQIIDRCPSGALRYELKK